jgi:hypothetical protein
VWDFLGFPTELVYASANADVYFDRIDTKTLCTRRSTWTGPYLEDYDGSQGIMGMRHYEKRADVGGDVHSGAYTSAVPAESYVLVYSMGVEKS